MTIKNSESLKERTDKLKADPLNEDEIFAHLANGGSLIGWCEVKDVRYSDILIWMNDTDERRKKLTSGLEYQTQWMIDRIIDEIKMISLIDLRKLYDADDVLLPVSKWPDDVARSVAGIDVDEIWETEEEGGRRRKVQVGQTKKIKLFDKLKALEMLGRKLGQFVQKHEVSGKLTLEDLVTGSQKDGK